MDVHVVKNLGPCTFCEQGLLQIMTCTRCGAIVAICDECELIWSDMEARRRNPQIAASGSHPRCPVCQQVTTWQRPTEEDLPRTTDKRTVARRPVKRTANKKKGAPRKRRKKR